MVQLHRNGDLSSQFQLIGIFAELSRFLDDFDSSMSFAVFHFSLDNDPEASLANLLAVNVLFKIIFLLNFSKGAPIDFDPLFAFELFAAFHYFVEERLS